jgi:hypothetical protein
MHAGELGIEAPGDRHRFQELVELGGQMGHHVFCQIGLQVARSQAEICRRERVDGRPLSMMARSCRLAGQPLVRSWISRISSALSFSDPRACSRKTRVSSRSKGNSSKPISVTRSSTRKRLMLNGGATRDAMAT